MQPGMVSGPGGDGRRGPGQTPLPFDLLQQMLNPENARSGDAVYSQEAFDRIMTQLMEQQNGSTAPPPASDEAIRSLGKKKVDREMLGEDGKAECSICMDNVELGSEVTFLPCNHWFHGDCVISWLKEHDTCPHCRKPISDADAGQRPEPSRRRSRRASSLSSPRPYPPDGTRYNPTPIPESPSELRNARQEYYNRRRERDEDRPDAHRHSSSHSDLRRHSSRSHRSSNGQDRGGTNNARRRSDGLDKRPPAVFLKSTGSIKATTLGRKACHALPEGCFPFFHGLSATLDRIQAKPATHLSEVARRRLASTQSRGARCGMPWRFCRWKARPQKNDRWMKLSDGDSVVLIDGRINATLYNYRP